MKNLYYTILGLTIVLQSYADENQWKLTLDTSVISRDSPSDYNGAYSYNGNPLGTFIVNGKTDDFSQKYWVTNTIYSLSYGLSENLIAMFSYESFKGDFQDTSTQSLTTNEYSSIYSLIDGRRLGNLGITNTSVDSVFKFRTKGQTFGVNVKHKIGSFNYGLAYSFSKSETDINLFQERATVSHILRERIDSKSNRLALLLGYKLNLVEDLAMIVEADLGLVFNKDNYKADHSGIPNLGSGPPFAETAKDLNSYVYFNPEFKVKVEYTVGKWAITPYVLFGVRQSPVIDYDLPSSGESITNIASNSGVQLKREEDRYWGAGISLSLSF